MRIFSIQLILLTLIIHTTCAQDIIEFKNGDIITGRIIEKNTKHVHFKSAMLGPITLNTDDISKIQSPPQEKSELDSLLDSMASSKINSTTQQPNMPRPLVIAKQILLPAPAPQKKRKKHWSGQTGLSIAIRETTQEDPNSYYQDDIGVYNFYGHIDWKGEQNKFRWKWTYRYSEDEDEKRDDYLNLSQNYTYTFKTHTYLFASAKTEYQRNYKRLIENEYLQTAEFGINWFKKNSKVNLKTAMGGGYHQYDRFTNQDRTTLNSYNKPKLNFNEKFSWNLVNSLKLIQSYAHLGDFNKYHFNFSAGLENKLINELFVRIEYKIDKDNDFNSEDRIYTDKALLTSLLYKF